MSVRSTLTAATAALALHGVLLATAGTAAAAPPAPLTERTTTTRTFSNLGVDWTENDPGNLLNLPGNVHQGYLGVQGDGTKTHLYGQIDDWQCDPGEVPGGHGQPGGEGVCDLVQSRYLESSEMTLAVDLVARTAKATGKVTVSNGGHGEPGQVLAVVPATIELRSTARLASFTRSERWSDGQRTYRSRVRGQASTQATVAGALGRMGFVDDADDVSSGYFQKATEVSRERVR